LYQVKYIHILNCSSFLCRKKKFKTLSTIFWRYTHFLSSYPTVHAHQNFLYQFNSNLVPINQPFSFSSIPLKLWQVSILSISMSSLFKYIFHMNDIIQQLSIYAYLITCNIMISTFTYVTSITTFIQLDSILLCTCTTLSYPFISTWTLQFAFLRCSEKLQYNSTCWFEFLLIPISIGINGSYGSSVFNF
jgi:hypothetical protein